MARCCVNDTKSCNFDTSTSLYKKNVGVCARRSVSVGMAMAGRTACKWCSKGIEIAEFALLRCGCTFHIPCIFRVNHYIGACPEHGLTHKHNGISGFRPDLGDSAAVTDAYVRGVKEAVTAMERGENDGKRHVTFEEYIHAAQFPDPHTLIAKRVVFSEFENAKISFQLLVHHKVTIDEWVKGGYPTDLLRKLGATWDQLKLMGLTKHHLAKTGNPAFPVVCLRDTWKVDLQSLMQYVPTIEDLAGLNYDAKDLALLRANATALRVLYNLKFVDIMRYFRFTLGDWAETLEASAADFEKMGVRFAHDTASELCARVGWTPSPTYVGMILQQSERRPDYIVSVPTRITGRTDAWQ